MFVVASAIAAVGAKTAKNECSPAKACVYSIFLLISGIFDEDKTKTHNHIAFNSCTFISRYFSLSISENRSHITYFCVSLVYCFKCYNIFKLIIIIVVAVFDVAQNAIFPFLYAYIYIHIHMQ